MYVCRPIAMPVVVAGCSSMLKCIVLLLVGWCVLVLARDTRRLPPVGSQLIARN